MYWCKQWCMMSVKLTKTLNKMLLLTSSQFHNQCQRLAGSVFFMENKSWWKCIQQHLFSYSLIFLHTFLLLRISESRLHLLSSGEKSYLRCWNSLPPQPLHVRARWPAAPAGQRHAGCDRHVPVDGGDREAGGASRSGGGEGPLLHFHWLPATCGGERRPGAVVERGIVMQQCAWAWFETRD